jgi:hypothetical protein
MVVGQLNVKRILPLKPEHDAPIRSNRNRPEPLQVAFQRMQPIARQIERLRCCSRIENRKNSLYRIQQVRAYPASIAAFIKALESSVLEAPNHNFTVYSDNCRLSIKARLDSLRSTTVTIEDPKAGRSESIS